MWVTGTSRGLVFITTGLFTPGFVMIRWSPFCRYYTKTLVFKDLHKSSIINRGYLFCAHSRSSLAHGQKFRGHGLSGEPSISSAHEPSLLHNFFQGTHALTLLQESLHSFLQGSPGLIQRFPVTRDIELGNNAHVKIPLSEELCAVNYLPFHLYRLQNYRPTLRHVKSTPGGGQDMSIGSRTWYKGASTSSSWIGLFRRCSNSSFAGSVSTQVT